MPSTLSKEPDTEIVQEFAKQYNLTLETYKKDHNNRLYFVYKK